VDTLLAFWPLSSILYLVIHQTFLSIIKLHPESYCKKGTKYVRMHKKRDAWVLLAFNFLTTLMVSTCFLYRSRIYPLYDQNEWDNLVTGLLNQHVQFDIDPLGQACLAYLCLTTSNPTIIRYIPTVYTPAKAIRSIYPFPRV
jgi:hypothetical protein